MKPFFLFFTSLFLMACAVAAPFALRAETPTAMQSATSIDVAPSSTPISALPSLQPPAGLMPGNKPCGDGVCNGPENGQNCPADCALTPGVSLTSNPSPSGRGTQHTVTNPASGATLFVQIFYPDTWNGQTKLPTLILVPGGSGDSSTFVRPAPQGPSTVDSLTQAGYVAIVFDPDGRGQSGGTEDYDGFIHQDGLAAVIRFAAALPGVDSANLGLVTYSYGITMGAGALARYPDLPVKFLIDWEGPANRKDTGGCDGAGLGHLKEVAACSDETFWAQREASTFIGQIRVPYQRIQSEKDHVQPDNSHAILMVNNAVAGGVPWVRLNNLPPNQTYDQANPPALLPEGQSRLLPQLTLKYLEAMFALQ